MEPQPVAKTVVPNPRIPRTLGIMNVVFASGLMLCGLCYGAYFAIVIPITTKMTVDLQKKVQAQQETQKKAELATLDDLEKEAKSDQEKLDIRAKRLEIQNRPKAVMPGAADLESLGWNEPKVKTFFWVDFASGLILNVLLLAAGIGLLQRKSWGLNFSLGIAGTKIVRLVLLYGYYTVAIVPDLSLRMAKMAQQAIVQQQGGGKPPPANMYETLARTYNILGAGLGIAMVLIGVIYPVVSLWLLTRPGVRAACSGKVPVTEQDESW